MNSKGKDGVVREKVLELIQKEKEIKPDQISHVLRLSRSMVHRHLKNLLKEKRIEKVGSAPRVFYVPVKNDLKNRIRINLKDEVEFIARVTKPIFKKYGLKKVQLFGSASRGEMNKNSDVDFLVEMGRPLGYEFVGLAFDLEDILGRKVDVVTKDSLSQFIKPYIQKDLKTIYER